MSKFLPGDDKNFSGNWWPFPVPDKGLYFLRQMVLSPPGDPRYHYQFHGLKRVYEASRNAPLMCMGRRVAKMRAHDGWQFKFVDETKNGAPVLYRPYALIYAITPGRPPQIVRKDDVSQQLPLARSRLEALHIIRLMPDRWPVFRKIHVEYTEEVMRS
jgi:hypothetical protein